MTSAPLSRQDQQRATREALVFAARAVFARDGYHGANLTSIAREAGFSKGAVYSNFSGKAELFLAVMDANIDAAFAEGAWSLEDLPDRQDCADPEVDEAMQGMGMATLEFIAAASRDPGLRSQMGARLAVLIDGYGAIAGQSTTEQPGTDGTDLDRAELGALLAALDQGAALLMLSGSSLIDQHVLRAGMRRLLVGGTTDRATDRARGTAAMHDPIVRQRIATALGAHGTPSGHSTD